MKKLLFITNIFLLCLTCKAQIITTVAGGYGDGVLAINSPINQPYAVAMDSTGNLYFADYANHRIRKINSSTGIISTIAGNGTPGFGGDGAAATTSVLNEPTGLFIDNSGNIFIADRNNNRIRKINTNTGIISTVAGNGMTGYAGDGVAATATSLFGPTRVVVDTSGNLYISDQYNNRIRKVNASTGNISTIAGNGTYGYSGDGAAATAANLSDPSGLAVDGSGNLYIADFSNHRIRKVNAITGIISTFAGNGTQGSGGDGTISTSASLNHPEGLFLDGSGNLHIADYSNNKIRKVNAITGIISTIVGGGSGGDGTVAIGSRLDAPEDLIIDNAGNLYIAERFNYRIRKVNAITSIISTVAGNGNAGYSGDGAISTNATLYNPSGVTIDRFHNLFISDSENRRIRKVNSNTGVISTVAGGGVGIDGVAATAAYLSSPQGSAIDGWGNIFIADLNNHRIRKVNAITGIITTVAGNGTKGSGGDGGSATAANLSYPTGIVIDASGNLLIVDQYNHRIRKVTVSTGIISTVAGNGIAGYGGDGAAATAAYLYYPNGVSVDGSGNIFIADNGNHRIRKVNVNTGIITTVAGNGTSGYGGDGGNAIAAKINNPSSVAIDDFGNLYIADKGNHRIRKVIAGTGIITTIAGNGTLSYFGDGTIATSAGLYSPNDVTLDSAGNLYIADYGNNRIRKIWYSIYNNTISNSQTICSASNANSIIGSTPLGNNGIYTYIWLKSTTSATTGFSAIAASNTINYTPDALTQNTWFRRYVISGIYFDTSTAVLISVIPKPSVGFTINNASQCVNANNFIFTDTSNVSSGTISRKWNLGNGINDTSSLSTLNKIYASANTYLVKLVSTSNNGCKDSVIKIITVNPKPIVDFTSPTLFCLNNSNTSFNINNNSSISTGSLTYNWQFSDNTSSSLLNPTKTVTDTGYLGVKLIATSNNSCKDSITKTININFKPSAGFTVNNSAQCLIGNNFLFSDSSIIASGAITRKWNFGTGNNDTSSLLNPSKSYSSANTLSVKLVTTSNYGCIDSIIKSITVYSKPNVGFTVNNVVQCINGNNFSFTDTSNISLGTINYRQWNLGTGINDTSIIVNPTKTYYVPNTYTIKIVAASNNGCKDSITKTITVHPKPDVYFMINNTSQCLKGNSFIFADSTYIPTGIFTRKWNFGEGINDTAINANPTKTYATANTYAIKLVATNNNNCKDSMSANVMVNNNVTANFNIINASQCLKGNNFSFTNTSTNSNTQTWIFGDASNSAILSPTKIYSNAGSYNVKLLAKNEANCNDSITKTVVVNPQPIAAFSINNPLQCLNGNNFLFTDNSSIAAENLNRLWTINNTDTSSNFTTNKSFTNAGTYNIKLVSNSNNNCMDSIVKTVIVHPQPKAGFTINSDSQCVNNNSFVFTDTTINNTNVWSTGIGNYQTTNVAQQTYTNVGNYTITQVIKSANNCIDSTSKTIYVKPKPIVGIVSGQTTGLIPSTPYAYTIPQQLNHTYNWIITNGIVTAGQGTNAATVQWISAGNGSVKVEIKNILDCSDTANLAVNITTVGINNFSLDNDLKVYPNPTKTSITITNKTNLTGKKYNITNLVGQTVITGKLNLDETIVNLETLQSGMYFLSIDGLNKQSIKVIKE